MHLESHPATENVPPVYAEAGEGRSQDSRMTSCRCGCFCCTTQCQTGLKDWRHAESLRNADDTELLRSLISKSAHQSLYWNSRPLAYPVMTLE